MEIHYKLEETGVYYGDKAAPTEADFVPVVDGATGSFGVTVDPTSATATTVTNILPVGALTVSKNWVDYDDRDGLRPTELQLP